MKIQSKIGSLASLLARLILTFLIISTAHAQQEVRIEDAVCPNCPFPDEGSMRYFEEIGASFKYMYVPENRKKNDSKLIRLTIEIFRAKSPNPLKDPIVFLHGGPGGSGVGGISAELDYLRQDRDVIVLDQRGAGLSGPDFCPQINKEIFKILAQDLTREEEIAARVKLAATCKQQIISNGIDISAYNSSAVAADLADLKRLLGIEEWNLWGISYGTRIALTALRDFPKGIRSVIVEASIPPNAPYFENISANFRRSLQLLFTKCANDPSCHKKFPNLESDFQEAIGSLNAKPMVIEMGNPDIYPDGKFVLNAQDILLGFQQALHGSAMYGIIPLMIQAVKERNQSAIKGFVDGLAGGAFRLDYGLYYSVICNESMPFNSDEGFKSETGPFAEGLTFYRSEMSICHDWKLEKPDSIEHLAVKSNIPVMILTGEMDPIAPPDHASLTALHLEKNVQYVFKNTGHSVSSRAGCVVALMKSFIDNPTTHQRDTVCQQQVSDINFVTDIHISQGILPFATKLTSLNNHPVFIGVLLVVTLSLLATIIFSIVKMVRFSSAATKRLKLPIILISLIGIGFLAGLVYLINATAHQNRLILLFGLPSISAIILIMPYLIIAAAVIIAFVFFKREGKRTSDMAFIGLFLFGSVFLFAFSVYNNLIY